jgi:hypothetical protein
MTKTFVDQKSLNKEMSMKKKQQTIASIIVLIILTLFVCPVWVQAWVGNKTITNSTDIDDLSGHTEVTGNLFINSDTLTSLSGLEGLTSVGGHLVIQNNLVLTSLSGLHNITSVGCTLYILENPALTSLSALSNITSVGGYLWIYNNDTLTSLSGLSI